MKPLRHAAAPLQYACAAYCASLLTCYLSSTVFHSAFQLVGAPR